MLRFAFAVPAISLIRAQTIRFVMICSVGLLILPCPIRAEPRQWLQQPVLAAVTNATLVRPSARWETLNLTIGLPLRNPEELTNLLHQIYDPASPNFHHYLTPDEFTRRFGPTEQDYAAVVNFAQTHGLFVTVQHPNRMLVSVRGTVADVQSAFHVNLNEYQHPTEARTFRAPNTTPSLDLAVPVLSVNGLDNYLLPHPNLVITNLVSPKPDTGSAPGGLYFGKDFRAAYVPGVPLTGTGQTVGLLEFDAGYYQTDITAFETQAGFPNVPLKPVLLDGYNGAGGASGANGEVSLDIEMAISMAPGLQQVLVYEGSSTDDILNRMATDNLARQLSASWTYPIDATSDQIFLQFAAQGQTFVNSSGDGDADVGSPATPTDNPNITIVGGTTLTTTGAGGSWVSESAWNSGGGEGSSGGISTRYAIPSWQQGIDMTANQGSTTKRNLPDVAMVANQIYLLYNNGQNASVVGTSCSTPLWAGLIALVNELALTNAQPAVGFINPAIYSMGKGSNSLSYTSLFHDITAGNNESPNSPNHYQAVPGYDLCTGWGTPQGSNFITALALPESLRISPRVDVVFGGTQGGPFSPASQTYLLTNKGVGALNWALPNPPAWLDVSPTSGTLVPGGPATVVTVSIDPSATNLSLGTYTSLLSFTNLSDNFVQSVHITLAVVTTPAITSQPTSLALVEGMTADFTVGIASNSLVYCQWQKNGINLVDGGNISGSTSATLSIANVAFTSAGIYSVIVSNAAGMAVSSNALLTVNSSAPVIYQAPTNLAVLPGYNGSFTVVPAGNPPFSYQWSFNGVPLPNGIKFSGTTTSSLSITNVVATNAGLYSVTINNSLGSVMSTGAVLSLIPVTSPGTGLAVVGGFPSGTGSSSPYCPVVQGRDGNYYGTSARGGASSAGTVFKVTPSGTVFALFSFNGKNGSFPFAGLCLGKDGSLYGNAYSGGTYDDGTLFKITTSGFFTLLGTFNGNNGLNPVSGLAQGNDGFFYGAANAGGAYGYGNVFRMSSTGLTTILASFAGTDGSYPSPVLVAGNDGNYYGTTESGGTNGDSGTIFRISPSGVLDTLYAFNRPTDGADPIAGLVLATDGNFYGTTLEGGAHNVGTVFKFSPAGEFTTLYSFSGGTDGADPWGGLVQARDGNLYGTTQYGGTYGDGTVFRIAPGGPLTTIVQFDGLQGANPSAALIQSSDGNLYGTTLTGGPYGFGAIYRITNGGPLQITGGPVDQSVYSGGNAIFTVATSGDGPLTYQWQQDGINLTNGSGISGATSATLTISNATLGDAAFYDVLISNPSTNLTSASALLAVEFSPPGITSQPADLTTIAGSTATFTVTVQGDQPLTYQWQENGTNLVDGGNIFGSATPTLTLGNVSESENGYFSVVISNDLVGTTSRSAQLQVVPASPSSVAATNLHYFTGGADGAFPYAALIQGRDGSLYGTASGGGASFQGTIFGVTTAGVMTTLYSFPYATTSGSTPYGSLVQNTNGTFFGTTLSGGANADGTVFSMTTSGKVGTVTLLYSFAGASDGSQPLGTLARGPINNYYSTAYQGGPSAFGCVYQMLKNGIVNVLYDFTGGADGGNPYAGLILGNDGSYYGTTTTGGGTNAQGTAFSITRAGALRTLATFTGTNGLVPQGGLLQAADGSFYGTTVEGGALGYGTVFRLSTNGGLTTLFSFAGTNGGYPAATLIQGTDGSLYGTTFGGGPADLGSVFKITTNGTLTTLLWFDGFNGANPQSALVQATDGNFYGTTPVGGPGYNPSSGGGYGTVFRLTVPAFIEGTFTTTPAVVGLPYTASMAGQAIAPAGDSLTFSLTSGPAWLTVSTNGALSGSPANSDLGTNLFVISLTDSNGFSANATLQIVVNPDPAPSFLASPFAEPWANVNQNYAGTVATNATTPLINQGDVLSFALVSGPAWLTVAPDGMLSGTPQGTDGGSNVFVVSVANLGGSSSTATMYVYVNSSPAFTTPALADAPATVGVPYAGTLATNATDPDLAAGDFLSFYKISGPVWLNVATNGALSGTPATTDAGDNSFQVIVVDSGGLADVATLDISVVEVVPPAFNLNPFASPPALAGQTFSFAFATNAVDSNPGDTLAFAKVSGPAWLTVSANGIATGTPFSTNAGKNTFVVSVSNGAGLSGNGTLTVDVTTIPLFESIAAQGDQWLLSWSGGVPPWQVQTTTNMIDWQNVGSPTTQTNLLIPAGSAAAFYRIQGQ